MHGQGQSLRNDGTAAVGNGGGEIHVVTQHPRIGGAAHGDRHLISRGEHSVFEKLERYPVDWG